MGKGPLSGVRIVEFAGIGPGPFCCMLLSDMGADIVRIDRKGGGAASFAEPRFDVASRGRRSVVLDLKNPASVEACLKLIAAADVLIEGFRPGVMERLGLGPDVALTRNPKLVYGRITGWGQDGRLAQAAGHDINYISITGALAAIGPPEKPVPPLNLVGDYGGGSMYLAMGVLAALHHAQATGEGQVVDCAMSDGAASLMAVSYGLHAEGSWTLNRRDNFLDGGAFNYDTYECADGQWISIASAEPPFYRLFREMTGLDGPEFDDPTDRARWPALKARVAEVFKRRTRDAWCEFMEGTDVCFAPVLDMGEAPLHGHNQDRGTFVEIDGVMQPGPAPRFSATPGAIQGPPPQLGAHNDSALADWGFSSEEVAALKTAGAIPL